MCKISLSFPYFKGKLSLSYLNVHVEQQLVMFLNIGENQEIVPLDSAVSTFLDSYMAFKKDFDSPQEWEISVDSKVSHQAKN
jgi:site-specific recombinase XerD